MAVEEQLIVGKIQFGPDRRYDSALPRTKMVIPPPKPPMRMEFQYAEAKVARLERLGPLASDSWRRDPKHLLFNLARYKFVAKMFAGRERVLEVGCGDGFGSRIVAQEVVELIATDIDLTLLEAAEATQPWHNSRVGFFAWDPLTSEPLDNAHLVSAVYALDVLEHVPSEDEHRWMCALTAALRPAGACIIGTPSLESQCYASEISRAGHVNCKTADGLRALMQEHFAQVFLFSMNDEVLHTGFAPMAHYLLALGVT